jgi:outer membrane protein
MATVSMVSKAQESAPVRGNSYSILDQHSSMTRFSFFLVGLFFANVAAGQSQKFGFVDSEIILAKMPQYSGISQRIDVLANGWREESDRLKKEITQLEDDYKAKEILYTKEVKERKLRELDDKKKANQRFLDEKFGPEGEYFKQQRELLLPVQQKLVEAIKKVAERDGYDFVFDRTGEVMVMYARAQWNLTPKVMQELGINPESTQ